MRPFLRFLLAGLAACLPLLAHADCSEQLPLWAKQLHPGRELDTSAATCKVSPANPAQTLAILPLLQPGTKDDDMTRIYDVDIIIADSHSGSIIASLAEPAEIISDAVFMESVKLDTARYQLTPQLRAFGVRTDYRNTSRVNPYYLSTLDLYVLDGSKLRRVVNKLKISSSNGEWDGNCAGNFNDITRTIGIAPTGTHGYARLQVSEKSIDSSSKLRGGDCVTAKKPARSTSYPLEFDGNQYPLPKALHYAD